MASSRSSRSPEPVAAALAAALERHVARGARLACGYSGGLDSSVLLHALHAASAARGIALEAIHVHHGLSPNADAWALHCAERCAVLGVPLALRRVHLGDVRTSGIEAAARLARYGAFGACGADWVALAHHRGDQAETVLHHLLRGTGVRGASGMPEVRAMRGSAVRLLRPLLGVPRTALIAYAQAHGLPWCEDESNADPRYTRNRLRGLLGATAGGEAALARAAGHFGEAQQLLDDLAAIDLGGAPTPTTALLCALAPARARNLLRHWLAGQGITLTSAALDQAWRQATQAGADRAIEVDLGVARLVRHRGVLQLAPRGGAQPRPMLWRGEETLDWGTGRLEFAPMYGAGLSATRLAAAPVEIAPRRGGERLRPRAGGPSRALKQLCQEQGVPAWQRPALPLLWCGGQLAWVGGLGADAAFAARADEAGWLVRWLPG